MCGIAGFIKRDYTDTSRAILQRMTDSLAHRGPDGVGYWFDDRCGVALGHRRLAIIDLSDYGHQPMTSCSGRYTIVFNGEIYNFVALRKTLERHGYSFRGGSDTEVMLAAFEHWGVENSISQFVGMFAFSLWDARERNLVLCRDRVGKKPLYYGFLNGGFAFASELRALVRFSGWMPEINRDALALYMRHNYVPAPWSIYSGVYKLPPGHILRVDASGKAPAQVSIDRYWSPVERQIQARARPFKGTIEEAGDTLEAVLKDATGLRMIADVPLGAFLSGGIDSSVVVAMMQSQATSPVRTFTIGFGEEGYDEAVHAKRVAKYLGTDHTELYISSADALSVIPKLPLIYDEPFSDSSQIPTYLVSRLARQHVTVALSGDGGDEGFCGYNRYTWWRQIWGKTSGLPRGLLQLTAKTIESIPVDVLNRLLHAIYPVLPSNWRIPRPGDRLHKLAPLLMIQDPFLLYRRLVSHFDSPNDVVLGACEPKVSLPELSVSNDAEFIDWMMLLDTLTYLPDDILVKVDRASMAVGLEARAPLLDHRVLEFAWSLPLEMKLKGGVGKLVLRNVLYRHIPAELVERPKAGFAIPLDEWLRGPLRHWAEELLDTNRMRSEGYFSVDVVRKIWDEHQSGARQWQYHIWDVLMFQAWLEHARREHALLARSEGFGHFA